MDNVTIKNNSIKIPDYIKGQVRSFCYMVVRGKPAANIAVQKRYTNQVVKLIKNEFDLFTTTKEYYPDWTEIWIYKYVHIGKVISTIPRKPKTITEHWLLGKLFGYSEQAIHDFIKGKNIK